MRTLIHVFMWLMHPQTTFMFAWIPATATFPVHNTGHYSLQNDENCVHMAKKPPCTNCGRPSWKDELCKKCHPKG